jgi:hypothetical protein
MLLYSLILSACASKYDHAKRIFKQEPEERELRNITRILPGNRVKNALVKKQPVRIPPNCSLVERMACVFTCCWATSAKKVDLANWAATELCNMTCTNLRVLWNKQ